MLAAENPPAALDQSPTRIRYWLLTVATANAFLLYLDRICMTAVVDSNSFQDEFLLTKDQSGTIKSAFFFAYALGQPGAGWLADRFGPRRMLVVYIVLWSLCTALTGVAWSLATLIVVRLLCGLAEAGAYPASARVISRWFPFSQRARASSVVAFGGRMGGAVALALTASFIVAVGSWRPVLWTYGALGIGLAAATWWVFRDDPRSHPGTNEAERAFILGGQAPPPTKPHPFPWRALLSHRGLWLLSLAAVGMNIGSTFLLTDLPDYLNRVHGADKVTASYYGSAVLFVGWAGMLLGGWWCDALTRWFGPKWGRRLPFVFGSMVAGTAYMICPFLPNALAACIACSVVALAVDSIVPAVWALSQDMGRAHVGATIAWSNMWGNLGASAAPKLIPLVLAWTPFWPDWRGVFWACAGGFVICGISALFIDSTRGLEDEPATRA
jgi:MFS family permease